MHAVILYLRKGPMKKEARKLLEEAYNLHLRGDVDRAIELYRQSIEIEPTAKAYTFLGWAYSMKGDYEKAIEACRRAIDLDPEYGNPYNDIGAYLIELGRAEEAIPWLKRALAVRNFEVPHFAHLNMARAYLALGRFFEALESANRALDIDPGYRPTHEVRHQILAMLN